MTFLIVHTGARHHIGNEAIHGADTETVGWALTSKDRVMDVTIAEVEGFFLEVL